MVSMSGHILLLALALTFLHGLVHSQSQVGFISIDCGSSADYYDNTTGIAYSTDAPYITTGKSYEVLSIYRGTANTETQFSTVRSFPNGTRNCYTLLPQQGKNVTKNLIRARFMYGNYDSKNLVPEFDLYFGVHLWTTVKFEYSTSVVTEELVYVISSNVTYVCLVNTGQGTPFISALELRPLTSTAYKNVKDTVALYSRQDFGNEERSIRFPYDEYDRIWEPRIWSSKMDTLSTNLAFDGGMADTWFRTPTDVMGTAVTPINSKEPIEFYWKALDRSTKYYIYMHFGEVEKLQGNQTREFVVKLNGALASQAIPSTYLYSIVSFNDKAITGDWFNYSVERTANSTLPPIMNALEVFIVKEFLESETDQDDVTALKNIQSVYGVVKDWVADPCAPQNHTWSGISCTYSDYDPPRVVSLNLSSSMLTGEISEYISGLKLLQHLDLLNNKLNGSVPDFLSQMTSLTVLNLSGNNLDGRVPSALAEKSRLGLLMLSTQGNPKLCALDSCSQSANVMRKKSNLVTPIIASLVVVVVLVVVIISIAIFWRKKRNHQKGGRGDTVRPEPSDLLRTNSPTTFNTENSGHQTYRRDPSIHLKARNQRFSFNDVIIMTNNFERVLGKGGGGIVYYGILENKKEVAVKKLRPSLSSEDYKQFHTEAEILMMVHHANLTSMMGYCHEGKHLCVIYELMANGNLEDYLSPGANPNFPSWEQRLNIALDAAQGLEYLHHGCKPAIVHRDVKSTNILLNNDLRAKVADFGISKIFPDDKCTHVTTGVKGTAGYLDPELMNSLQLNEKSDVYAFGVVLCEIITGQRAIIDIGNNVKENIASWVSNTISVKGNVRAIVDPRLKDDFDVNSAWKLVETATACISTLSIKRPTMNQVVIEIKQCLDMEKARKQKGGRRTGHLNSTGDRKISLNISSEGPSAR